RGVTDVKDYLERVIEFLTPATPTVQRSYSSPFSLPEAMDYLDAVWQVRFKKKLLRLGSTTAAAELALPCSTEDEFRSRVSAFSDALARMNVPATRSLPQKAGSLIKLEAHIKASVPTAGMTRISDAIAILKAIAGIRAGTEHSDARARE